MCVWGGLGNQDWRWQAEQLLLPDGTQEGSMSTHRNEEMVPGAFDFSLGRARDCVYFFYTFSLKDARQQKSLSPPHPPPHSLQDFWGMASLLVQREPCQVEIELCVCVLIPPAALPRKASASALHPAVLGKSRPCGGAGQRDGQGGPASGPSSLPRLLRHLPARAGLQSSCPEQVGRMGSSRFPVEVTAVGLLKHGRQKVAWP